jgi:hypothetical protein
VGKNSISGRVWLLSGQIYVYRRIGLGSGWRSRCTPSGLLDPWPMGWADWAARGEGGRRPARPTAGFQPTANAKFFIYSNLFRN